MTSLKDMPDSNVGLDALYAALGLQQPQERIDILSLVRTFFNNKGFTTNQVWVESFRYEILRLGTTHSQFRYVRAVTDSLLEELTQAGYTNINIRISKRRNGGS